jgi:hypothetical protein
MATSMVFLLAQVSADPREGTNILRRVMTLTAETATRTQNERGFAIRRGRGHPDEKSNINPCILRFAHLLANLFVFLERETVPLSPPSKNLPNRLYSLRHSLSARKTIVQSESRTLSAFLPRQYFARASFLVVECTISNLYGWALNPDGLRLDMSRHDLAEATAVGFDLEAVGFSGSDIDSS